MIAIASDIERSVSAFRQEAASGYWVLRGDLGCGHRHDVEINRLPFRIGRSHDADLVLNTPEISRLHAEIIQRDGQLWLHECGSTNGTFVNDQRMLWARRISVGDSIRFGTLIFEVNFHSFEEQNAITDSVERSNELIEREVTQTLVDTMLRQRSVVPYFQPLHRLSDGELLGYEILGRCNFAGLPRDPSSVLKTANDHGRQIDLSELFRATGLESAMQLGNEHTLFLNAAPSEVEPQRLATSLLTLRDDAPNLPLVLEISEAALTDHGMLRELRALLSDLDIGLAYDDFGIGQARLLEIIDIPPDWLKFDLQLIQCLRHSPDRARTVLAGLISTAHDLGILTVAEGIETESELAICESIGFDVGQGFYLGRPLPFLAYR